MPLSQETQTAVKLLNRVASNLKLLFARRDTAVDLMRLSLLCREHLLLLGPPGTGKSELAVRFANGVQTRHFQYLLTRFTEPSELFGPVDLQEYKKGRYHVRTEGMLPDAQTAFLDEVFQAGSAILNTLLTLIHERMFSNGSQPEKVPLISLFGASNHLPDDPTLRAFSDRFVLRLQMAPVPDESLADLMDKGWDLELAGMEQKSRDTDDYIDPDRLDLLYKALPEIGIGAVREQYQEVVRRLRAECVELSDRRIVKGLKLIRAAALLDGRDQADNRDLWPLNHIWSSPEDIAILRDTVQPLVDEAGGPGLDTHRPLIDLQDEFDLLASRAPGLKSEGACFAHLSALAQIRRELMVYHVEEHELLKQVEGVIQNVLEAMRAAA